MLIDVSHVLFATTFDGFGAGGGGGGFLPRLRGFGDCSPIPARLRFFFIFFLNLLSFLFNGN